MNAAVTSEPPTPVTMVKPIVEIDGDEMARVMMHSIRENLVRPHVALDLISFDLSVTHRDATQDAVTREAIDALVSAKVAVKCATITADRAKARELGLRHLLPSPNAAIRRRLGGVDFREPILAEGIVPLVRGWDQPIVIARHAHADQYLAQDLRVEEAGTASLVFQPATGGPTVVREIGTFPSSGGVLLGMYNYIESIESFATSCFEMALSRLMPVCLSTKSTVLQNYDGAFVEAFERVFAAGYQAAFAAAGLRYEHRLIDDVVAYSVRSRGGFIWACKNYDGDVQSDFVAQGFGSPGMMRAALVSSREGAMLFEAPHGTIPRHFRRHQRGLPTSSNPVASIFAWSGALRERGRLDGSEPLRGVADAMEQATLDTIAAGTVTGDLAAARNQSDWATTDEFIAAVAQRVRGLLSASTQDPISSGSTT